MNSFTLKLILVCLLVFALIAFDDAKKTKKSRRGRDDRRGRRYYQDRHSVRPKSRNHGRAIHGSRARQGYPRYMSVEKDSKRGRYYSRNTAAPPRRHRFYMTGATYSPYNQTSNWGWNSTRGYSWNSTQWWYRTSTPPPRWNNSTGWNGSIGPWRWGNGTWTSSPSSGYRNWTSGVWPTGGPYYNCTRCNRTSSYRSDDTPSRSVSHRKRHTVGSRPQKNPGQDHSLGYYHRSGYRGPGRDRSAGHSPKSHSLRRSHRRRSYSNRSRSSKSHSRSSKSSKSSKDRSWSGSRKRVRGHSRRHSHKRSHSYRIRSHSHPNRSKRYSHRGREYSYSPDDRSFSYHHKTDGSDVHVEVNVIVGQGGKKEEKEVVIVDQGYVYARCDVVNNDPKQDIAGYIAMRQKPGGKLELKMNVTGYNGNETMASYNTSGDAGSYTTERPSMFECVTRLQEAMQSLRNSPTEMCPHVQNYTRCSLRASFEERPSVEQLESLQTALEGATGALQQLDCTIDVRQVVDEIWPDLSVVYYNGSYHQMHIHQYGDFSNGCASFGGHFKEGVGHGGPNDGHQHKDVGDFGNIWFDRFGESSGFLYLQDAVLRGVNSVVGRGIVIHSAEDDMGNGRHPSSHKTGNAGDRMACCVIAYVAPMDNLGWLST